MKHEYVDIPSLPEPLQSLHWRRQAIARDLGQSLLKLNEISAQHLQLINDHIQINEQINQTEQP